jgi:hypothetical protein
VSTASAMRPVRAALVARSNGRSTPSRSLRSPSSASQRREGRDGSGLRLRLACRNRKSLKMRSHGVFTFGSSRMRRSNPPAYTRRRIGCVCVCGPPWLNSPADAGLSGAAVRKRRSGNRAGEDNRNHTRLKCLFNTPTDVTRPSADCAQIFQSGLQGHKDCVFRDRFLGK